MNEKNTRRKFLYLGLKKDRKEILNELIIPVIIFSTIGGFYWAISMVLALL